MRNDLNAIINDISAFDAQIAEIKRQRDSLQSQLQSLIQSDVNSQLTDKDYGCGTANVDTGEYKVKVVVSKKVTWDQAQLAGLYDRIKASGENPLEYLKVKYDVPETAYKNWPSVIQTEFEGARTVEPSTPKISFERKE